jgi:hypothetical protein
MKQAETKHYKTKILPKMLLVCIVTCACNACGPARFTANDVVAPMPNITQIGVNLGHFPPKYTGVALADLARQYGAQTVRAGLFLTVLDQWGYDCNVEVFKAYRQLGLRNTAVIIGFPSENARDTAFFCPERRSELFRGLYEPIWKGGRVNEANLFAQYVSEIAKTYKGLVKTYEVWNEPDAGNGNGWRERDGDGNWWQNPPPPCETALNAPVFHYIRMLRITYEVVKKTDPDALVAVGGLGWPSYLDAICRYTDEPISGSDNSPHYPLKGGAYFDCMSFHAYPHLSIKTDTKRQLSSSDAAFERFWEMKAAFKEVLDRHGYDGQIYPAKQWICTEFNLPRTAAHGFASSERAQAHFILKTLVAAQSEGVTQMHLFSLADEASHDNEFAQMGLFHDLSAAQDGHASPHEAAWAFKTASQLLANAHYDHTATQRLNLPENLRGYAFKDSFGQEMLVLWATPCSDESDAETIDFILPEHLLSQNIEAMDWQFSKNGQIIQINSKNIKLSTSPLFLRPIPTNK